MAFWALLGDPNNSTPKGTGGARCTAGFKSDLCPLWVQKQTSRRHLANVRFTSQSGHARVASRSPAQKVYILHKKLSLSGALCAKPPLSRRLPPGCSERPRMRTRASLRGFFFSVMGERFAAIRIDLARKIGTLLFASIADRAKPRLRPESGAFSFCRSGCSDQDFAAFNLSAKRRLCNTVGKRFIDGARRCCAVFTARSRAAATTNLARSSQSLVLSALFFCAAAKSWATANVFMISPPGRAAGS